MSVRVTAESSSPELARIRARVSELEETLEAIRSGAVDALVVSGPNGEQVFTLQGAEQPYRVLVEAMNEGAATLDRSGIILYCNNRFAEMTRSPLEKVLAAPFESFLAPREKEAFRKFFRRAVRRNDTLETTLWRGDGDELNVLLSANGIPLQESRGVCLVITDITQRKAMEDARRFLSRSIIEAQERERQRVALELHDGINQLLTSTKHRIHGIENRLNGANPELRSDISKTRELLERTIHEVRLISRNLRPSELDDLGLLAAIRALSSEFTQRTGIAVHLRALPFAHSVSPEIELAVYRIFQEALSNVEKHSKAGRVDARVVRSVRAIQLSVRDNGKGFDPLRVNKARFGLANMRERASHVNGVCRLHSSPGHGTRIDLRIPA